MKNSLIYSQITKSTSIYNAIYSLESYIFEKDLLCKRDRYVYRRLKDKFDDNFISQYVDQCKNRIESIINSDSLFDCRVYFKAKKYDNNKVEFRPIHSARLKDQICMVVLLSVLMFDDSSEKRKLSDISRLLPANFYGNIPSTNINELFKPWNKQYKEYSDATLEANRNYCETGKYKYELTLDLVRFFPSINPLFLYGFILEKWPVSSSKKDKEVLKKILEKLLFFNVDIPKELHEYYYPKEIDKSYKFNLGIAQGLPQGYFFGNICMCVIAGIENKMFEGDSYFYVDDSVVYTNENVSEEKIKILEKEINLEIDRYCGASDLKNSLLKPFIENPKFKFHIEIHSLKGKSEFKEIDRIDSLFTLSKPASLLPFEIRTAQDEHEDITLRKKIEVLLKTVDSLIGAAKKNENQNELKRLYRFKKFYKNRLNNLKAIDSSGPLYTPEDLNEFIDEFQLDKELAGSKFFELLESDVFEFKSKLIARQLGGNELKNDLESRFLDFENKFIGGSWKDLKGYFYYNTVLSSIYNEKNCSPNNYETLKWHRIFQGIKDSSRRINTEDRVKIIAEITDLVK